MRGTAKISDKFYKELRILKAEKSLLFIDTVNEILLRNGYPENRLPKPTKHQIKSAKDGGYLWVEPMRLLDTPEVTSYLAEITIEPDNRIVLRFCDPTTQTTWHSHWDKVIWIEDFMLMEYAEFVASLLLEPEKWQVLREYIFKYDEEYPHRIVDPQKLRKIMFYFERKSRLNELYKADHAGRLYLLGIEEETE